MAMELMLPGETLLLDEHITSAEPHNAAGALLSIGDRIMQLVMELPPFAGSGTEAVQQQAGEGAARPMEALGLLGKLRVRAQVLLEGVAGALWPREQGPVPVLLAAWVALLQVGYFHAQRSHVRQLRVCVAMYCACENHLAPYAEAGILWPPWVQQARQLAACMPGHPDPGWLSEYDHEVKQDRFANSGSTDVAVMGPPSPVKP
jgi:hypothetical protein